MRKLIAFSTLALLAAGAATAQTPNQAPAGANRPAGTNMAPASPGTNSPTGSSNPAVSTTGNQPSNAGMTGTVNMVAPSALERGSNSFTEGQAKARLEGAGLTNVTDLKKDDQGIWRGKAMRAGKSVAVGFDYKGNIAAE